MSVLVALRHGKSGYPDGVVDHDRPLNERGHAQAELAGRLIADAVGSVDLALVSTATRAQETWREVRSSVAVAEERHEAALYLAQSEDLLAVVRSLPTDATTVVLVGHNDGLEHLVGRLTDEPVMLKTSTFAVVSSDRRWADWADGTGTLQLLVAAR